MSASRAGFGMLAASANRTVRSVLALALVSAIPQLSAQGVHAQSQSEPSLETVTSTQSLIVRGKVVSDDDRPIAFAEVFANDGALRVRVDERGLFVLRVPRGTVLRARALGFRVATAVADTALVFRLVPLPTMLTELLTTAGAREIRSSESPRSVTTITKEELSATASVSVNQALRNIPGLQEISAPPSKTSISIRGFDDSRVLVLVDGEPVAGGLIDSRDIGRLSTIAAERIEVTKGPSGVEFGSDAIGGVINLVQAAPTKAFTINGQLRQGELGRREGDVGVSQTLGIVGYRVSGGWRQSDRLPGINSTGSSFDRVYDLRGDVRVKPLSFVSLRFNGTGSQERQRWPVDQTFNGFIDNTVVQGFAEAVFNNVVGGPLRLRAFGQQFRYQYRQSRGLLPVAGTGDSLEQRETQNRYLAAYTRAFGKHTIDIGAQHSSRFVLSPSKVTGDSAEDNITEYFARESWQPGNLLFTAGVRHSSSSLWGSATNPSVGAAWQLTPELRFRANVARGFRAPGFKDIRYTFANPGAGYSVRGNPDLIPEHSISTATGFTWSVSNALTVDIEGHRNDVSNMIEMRYAGVNNAGLIEYQSVNIGNARTGGVESQLRMSTGGLDVVLGYDWLSTRDIESGLPLSRRASSTARLQLSHIWRDLFRGLNSDVSVRYTGEAPLVGTVGVEERLAIVDYQGAFLSADAQLRLSVSRFTELSAGANNLFNHKPAMWSPAFHRQWYAAVKLSYSAN